MGVDTYTLKKATYNANYRYNRSFQFDNVQGDTFAFKEPNMEFTTSSSERLSGIVVQDHPADGIS